MVDEVRRRAMVLILLGMGVFFLLAAVMTLGAWLLAGDWRSQQTAIAIFALLIAVPGAYAFWRYATRPRH